MPPPFRIYGTLKVSRRAGSGKHDEELWGRSGSAFEDLSTCSVADLRLRLQLRAAPRLAQDRLRVTAAYFMK